MLLQDVSRLWDGFKQVFFKPSPQPNVSDVSLLLWEATKSIMTSFNSVRVWVRCKDFTDIFQLNNKQVKVNGTLSGLRTSQVIFVLTKMIICPSCASKLGVAFLSPSLWNERPELLWCGQVRPVLLTRKSFRVYSNWISIELLLFRSNPKPWKTLYLCG